MSESVAERPKATLDRMLDWVERVGNKVPHPAVIFLLLAAFVIVLSHLLYMLGTSATYQVIDLQTHEAVTKTATVNSLLTVDGLRFILTSYLGFVPVGVILVAMVGVGLAEEAGLIKALIRKIVLVAPRRLITFIVVFMGALSSVASDAGYLVLIPLGAAAFLSLGRTPSPASPPLLRASRRYSA